MGVPPGGGWGRIRGVDVDISRIPVPRRLQHYYPIYLPLHPVPLPYGDIYSIYSKGDSGTAVPGVRVWATGEGMVGGIAASRCTLPPLPYRGAPIEYNSGSLAPSRGRPSVCIVWYRVWWAAAHRVTPDRTVGEGRGEGSWYTVYPGTPVPPGPVPPRGPCLPWYRGTPPIGYPPYSPWGSMSY